MNWKEEFKVDTRPLKRELAGDVWDGESCCSYSADGEKLLDAENFPDIVNVLPGTKIICDGVFAFQDYMAEDFRIGERIPEDERVSFLEKVRLPDSLTHIGASAFRECGWMKSIRLPKNLKIIGEEAFLGCWSLKSLSCPSSLLAIGDDAFSECFSLGKVRLNHGLKAIGAGAFFHCESLEEIALSAGLEFIGEDVFAGCRSLKRIFVPRGTRGGFQEMLPSSLHRKLRELK